ncbi:MAG: acyl-CoA thioesterase [Hydrococcus sp. RU_2_2]|nr:acyl-CoA thioesterase [Hydrococcus sp. RU_2_2]
MQEVQTKIRPFELEIVLSVQTYDIDFAGIVSNIVYVRWLEDMRLKIMEKYLPLDRMMAKGYCPTLASTQIEYKKALRLFDRPVGKIWLSDAGRLRFTLQAEIYHGERLATTASQTCFFVNIETMRPLAIPEEFWAVYRPGAVKS